MLGEIAGERLTTSGSVGDLRPSSDGTLLEAAIGITTLPGNVRAAAGVEPSAVLEFGMPSTGSLDPGIPDAHSKSAGGVAGFNADETEGNVDAAAAVGREPEVANASRSMTVLDAGLGNVIAVAVRALLGLELWATFRGVASEPVNFASEDGLASEAVTCADNSKRVSKGASEEQRPALSLRLAGI